MTTEDIRQAIRQGRPFTVDLRLRKLRLGRKNVTLDDPLTLASSDDPREIILTIESLYHEYKHSIPSELSNSNRSIHFRALDMDNLSDEDMFCGTDRHSARFELEAYMLACISPFRLTRTQKPLSPPLI